MARRTHSKITSILPAELVEAINQRLVNGETYEQIAAYVRGEGHEISKSSVGRYGKTFLTKLERLKIVREQAKTIVTESKDGPSLEMTEAATQLALQLIMEKLVLTENLDDTKTGEILKALALLERSAVQREKLKLEAKRKADEAMRNIESKTAGKKNLDPETLSYIKEQIYGITT